MFGSIAIVLRGKTIAQKVGNTHSSQQVPYPIAKPFSALLVTIYAHVCVHIRLVYTRIINLLCIRVNSKINFSLYFALIRCQKCRFIYINCTISIHICVFVGFLIVYIYTLFCIIIQFLPLLCALYHLIYILYNIARTCALICALARIVCLRK